MTSKELRGKYLEFFKARGHAIIPSASLIPENDPTALFTTAGMHPLVPYLMGEKHPEGRRLADTQKCVRTDDIEDVGDATHHTFFEMLGNWSLGDYFKEEAIKLSWEFLTSPDWLRLDKNKIAVSVFAGDKDAPFDEESFSIWKSLGVPEKRIAKLPKKNNWWGPAGQTGPCGPCTEMFYWTGDPDKVPAGFNDDNVSWVEIWNDVFMEFNRKADGSFEPLKQKNVDTGMGLERTLAVINNFSDNYQTDLFFNIINKIKRLSGKEYKEEGTIRAMRIIADHLRAATFIIGDSKGVTPSNTDQGYIVRRLLRRAIRYGKQLGIEKQEEGGWTKEVAKIVIHDYQDAYPELSRNADFIIEQFKEEEEKFGKTIKDGLEKARQILDKKKPIPDKIYVQIMETKDKGEILGEIYKNRKTKKDEKKFLKFGISVTDEEIIQAFITGEEAFKLYQSYGFPIEMILELVQEKNLFVDTRGFREELKKHQELSRTASAGKFKGGLADASEETKKLHTAAHLLLAALRTVLGKDVFQKGSNITAERLRFDFSHKEKMTPEQIKETEKLVNEAIGNDLPIYCEEMPLPEAKKKGAMGVFESKYGEKVKVYRVGQDAKPFSYEICGGPHVNRTGELGHFKIIKEESSSAGVRRIKAVLG
ncbi:MAG: alanine--tRNA ligase-related protein [Patescibacteria group bacterium]|nr:alanine--tRNA ligase-related protein [Patescibacteria group bacterium]